MALACYNSVIYFDKILLKAVMLNSFIKQSRLNGG